MQGVNVIPRGFIIDQLERYSRTCRPNISIVMITKTFSQISRTARVEFPVFLAPQNVDVIHDYFTGFEGAETAAHLNCEVKTYNSSCGKFLVTS
jgi:hypothetical protein